MAASNINRVEKAHQMYREGRYAEALGFYSSSLSIAKNTPQRIALHSNRAACFLKLHDFKQAADECTSVLELDNKHTGALMLRAQTLVTLKEYQSALFDVSRLLELNPSSEVYLNLQARLKTQLALAPIPEAEEEDEDTSEATVEGCSESDNDGEQTTTDNPAVSVVKHEQEDGDFDEFICSENNANTSQGSFDSHSNGWRAIPKPKGHSRLDYSRWDAVANSSSDEDDDNDEDDEETQPQYRFRVKTVDVRRV